MADVTAKTAYPRQTRKTVFIALATRKDDNPCEEKKKSYERKDKEELIC